MRNLTIKAAVIGALSLISAQAMATGFVSLPAAGFSVTGGTTPYTRCNTTGNYGSGSSTAPTSTANNTCAVFPTNINTSPISGYTLIASSTSPMILNDSAHTNGTNITVGTITDRVFRNSSTGQCIYGSRFTMANVDYDLNTAGTQYFEVNDFVRKGFSGRTTNIAYYYTSITDEVVFRAGHSSVSVQHRANLSNSSLPATGYVDQPLTTPTPASTPINGVASYTSPLAVPTSAQQSATLDADAIDFTTDNNFQDDDGTSNKDSAMMYVQTSCSSATTTTAAGAYSFRQTGQEDAPFIEFNITGYVPN